MSNIRNYYGSIGGASFGALTGAILGALKRVEDKSKKKRLRNILVGMLSGGAVGGTVGGLGQYAMQERQKYKILHDRMDRARSTLTSKEPISIDDVKKDVYSLVNADAGRTNRKIVDIGTKTIPVQVKHNGRSIPITVGITDGRLTIGRNGGEKSTGKNNTTTAPQTAKPPSADLPIPPLTDAANKLLERSGKPLDPIPSLTPDQQKVWERMEGALNTTLPSTASESGREFLNRMNKNPPKPLTDVQQKILDRVTSSSKSKDSSTTPLTPEQQKITESESRLLKGNGTAKDFITIANFDPDLLMKNPESISGGHTPHQINLIAGMLNSLRYLEHRDPEGAKQVRAYLSSSGIKQSDRDFWNGVLDSERTKNSRGVYDHSVTPSDFLEEDFINDALSNGLEFAKRKRRNINLGRVKPLYNSRYNLIDTITNGRRRYANFV